VEAVPDAKALACIQSTGIDTDAEVHASIDRLSVAHNTSTLGSARLLSDVSIAGGFAASLAVQF
jgi:hypothetical protein